MGNQLFLEMYKCYNDYSYFISKHCKLEHPINGLVPCSLQSYHRNILDNINDYRLNIILSCRQSGKSSTVAMYLLWQAVFAVRPETIYIISHTKDSARNILKKIRRAYEDIDPNITGGALHSKTVDSLVFANGSIICADKCWESALRGCRMSHLFLDEFAFVDEAVAKEFWYSYYPVISSSAAKITIASSANKKSGPFYETWENSLIDVNGFLQTFVDWKSVPRYTEEWKKKRIDEIGIRAFYCEYENVFGSAPLSVNSIHKLLRG